MAGEPLFDLDEVDLEHVELSVAQIEVHNPQRGNMRQLDAVICFDQDLTRILGVKHVGHDEFWVPEHIPGRPLFPGVLMIEACAQLASILYRTKQKEARFLGFTRCDEIAFRGQVVPGDTMYLMAEEVSINRRRFTTICQGLVDGKLVFEGKITGMVM